MSIKQDKQPYICFRCSKPIEKHIAILGAPGGMKCPERELPKYKRYQKTTDPKYTDGWNACLDEIIKKRMI